MSGESSPVISDRSVTEAPGSRKSYEILSSDFVTELSGRAFITEISEDPDGVESG